MATADQQKIATRKLNQWIENDRRIVTYRDISREVGCHVNIAKNLLLTHYSNNPEGYSPTYLLTGPLLSTSRILQTQLHSLTQVHSSSTQRVRIVDMDEMSEGDRNSEDEDDEAGPEEMGNDNGDESGLIGDLPNIGRGKGDDEDELVENEEVGRWGVVLVGEDGLEEKRKLFEQDTLSVHIHSLAPTPIDDPAQYLIPNLTLRQHANYHNPEIYGTISGESLKPSVPITGDKKAMKDGGMDWSGSKKVTAGSGSKKDEVKKKEETKKEEVKKANNKKQSPFTANTAAPAVAPTTKSTVSNTKYSGPDTKPTPSASGSLSGKKKRIIQSDTEEDEPTPSSKSKSKKTVVEPTSSMVRADDQKAMEAMMSMDMDMDMDVGLSDGESKDVSVKAKAKKESEEVQVKKEPGTESKIRKKRRVKKSRTVEDKKGRMVTKDYSTDESYTTSESEEAKSKPNANATSIQSKPPIKARESTSSIGSNNDRDRKTPASSGSFPPKKGSTGGAAKGQSTLKGFFTKK